MEKNKQLVPKRRFKEFEGDGEWERTYLGEIALFRQGVQVDVEKQATVKESKNIRFIRIVDYTQQTEDIRYINYSKKLNIVDEKDIVMVRYGATAGFVGRNIYGAIANNMFSILPNKDIKSSYLFIYLNMNKIYKMLNNSNGSSAMPALNFGVVSNVIIEYPQIKEQIKLSQFFDNLNNLITCKKNKIKKFEKIKVAYLSVMFPKEGEKYPKKRFEGFTETWQNSELGEIVNIKTGNTNVQDTVLDGKYTFFDRSTEIKRINTYYYDEEAIIYPGEGSEFYPRYFKGKYALHQRAYSITSDNVNLRYLSYMLLLRNDHFLKTAVGSTVKSLRMDNFNKCNILLPSLKEQEKIASLFFNLDKQINLEEQKLNKLEQLKQAYLNELFV